MNEAAVESILLVAGGPAPLRDAWAAVLGVESCDIATLHERLAHEPGLRGLVFYQSPWEDFLCGCDGAPGTDAGPEGRRRLQGWTAEAEVLLAAASRWTDRLRLVNAGRLATREQALVDTLVDEGWCVSVEAPATGGGTPVETALLATLFEEHAPEGWDAYESLESMATLLGREAEFRAAGADSGDLLAEGMRIWGGAVTALREARRAREQETRIETGRVENEELRARAERAQQALEEAMAERDVHVAQVSTDNELLLEHVAQLRQELAEQGKTIAELRDTVLRLSRAADQARRLISR